MLKCPPLPVSAALAALALVWLGSSVASAQDIKLPSAMTFTAYDTGTSGFNITVAVGKGLKEKYGTDLRVLPAGNDVARLAPLRAGRAQVSAMGVGIYYAQEGVLEFAVKDWGPQPLMLILSSIDCNGSALGIAKDIGVTEYKGLKGKRVGWVVGSPALNQNTLAMLSFAGLTKEDVKLVEFSSFGAMWKGMLTNDVDAAYASTITANAREVDTSPRGLVWPALPHSDAEGWKRLTAIGPYFTRHRATCGAAGLSPQAPKEMATFPYPLYTVMGTMSETDAYAITKAMIVSYDLYKDGAPGASGLGIKQQTTQWSIPFHGGAVKAFKEAGIWKPEDDTHNQGLVKRQGVLKAAWEAFLKVNPPSEPEPFRAAWQLARKSALEKAGQSTAPN